MPEGTCNIEGCPEDAYVRGWCNRHYLRWRRHGDPLGGDALRIRGTASDRFLANVDKNGPVPVHRPELGGCHIWTSNVHPKGYGELWDGTKVVRAHIWAYEQEHGPVPKGLELDHLCHNGSDCPGGLDCPHRRCVNPAHLEAVTHALNLQRGKGGMLTAARHRAKTECPQGHPYDAENTYITTAGSRQCRTCMRARTRKWRATKRKERERQSHLSTAP